MVVPFGSALGRRSRTTYRPTLASEGSTHVDTFTGTTSSFSRTDFRRLAIAPILLRLIAAKDRTFKTVRPNQGTAYGHARRRRRPGTNMVFVVP
jgi:hypothetical protein